MTAPARTPRTPRTPWRRFRIQLRSLYHGQSPQSVRFRLAIIVVDLALIGFFIAAPLLRDAPYFLALDYFCAAVLACDMAARALAFRSIIAFLKRPIVWADLFVLATLLAPNLAFNLGFLRVLRLWTLFHSEFFWATIGRRYDDTRVEDVTRAGVTLLTFLFIITGFVYTSFAGRHAGIDGYVDALYFTVATLTTTGFGDIVLPGTWGKLVSIATMICGITLFVRLAQALFRPHKVRFTCPTCALMEHDPDAVHCKACGTILNIPNNEA
ncbi:potassium channel family protein [Phenylobacterium immobile]|uniref:potassium channel family protein n=1 Tax=Phenylobacterium immobile TaxID=21 RepID=UPI000A58BA9D|nr:potassium channel family protein [Phenylobacterium immobile]